MSRTAGWISPVLLVDGVVAGTGSLDQRGRTAAVSVEPFATVGAATKKAAARYAQRYSRVLDAAVDLTWTA